MNSKSQDQLFDDKGYLNIEVLETYRKEEDKLAYATMRMLYLFFQRGIDLNLDHNYLDVICNNLERVCGLIFSTEMIDLNRVPDRSLSRLLYFARKPELDFLLHTLRFYELLLCTFEEYEACFNIRYVSAKIEEAVALKTEEPTSPSATLTA
jgi:hypothetical protein